MLSPWEDRTRELEQQLAQKWEQHEALLVRDKDSDILVARRLHEEVLSRVQKDAERVLEVHRREDHLRHDGLMSSLREELRNLKRNHQEEILLSVQEALRDLSFRESVNVACGNCPILEREKQDLREALWERERSLEEEVQRRQRMERVWEEEHRRLRERETVRELQESILTEQKRHANEEVLRQVEEARSCLEKEKLQLRDQEATLFRERAVQDLTLSRAYAELERQRVQLQVEQRAVELQQDTSEEEQCPVRDIWDPDSVPDGVSV
ncbi:hypothetical protein DYB35_012469 [Aphanomyces astaci]|uniref:Uncharacterized protein n=1 Tax=Aphanomyces astaci TaxID=112090 RepID=A0A3R7AYQ2_APHAT|nr:hypothetical protein DYB35_012469 [Aphanomyces astaci]